MTTERGTLFVRKTKNKNNATVDISGKMFQIAQGEISQSILDAIDSFDGKEVELERVGGQPKKLREIGKTFVPPSSTLPPKSAHQQATHKPQKSPPQTHSTPPTKKPTNPTQSHNTPQHKTHPNEPPMKKRTPDHFHNPYNFIPAPPRNTTHKDLGDHPPCDQHTFLADRYTGCICVKMITQTPLLLPDTENLNEDKGHKTYPLRVDEENKPLLPASSVRGMLRSAYEAITNSRFGRFSHAQHRERLAYRMAAEDAQFLIPARIQDGRIHLLTGTSNIGADGKPDGPMFAAWLPRYHNGQRSHQATQYANNTLPQHGDEVTCWIEQFQHHRWKWTDRKGPKEQWEGHHVPDFEYWKVIKIAHTSEEIPCPQPSRSQLKKNGYSHHEPLGQPLRKIAQAWVCVTNPNINRKHDERVFFLGKEASGKAFSLHNQHHAQWQELICNYQSLHKGDLDERNRNRQKPDQYLGSTPGKTAWSRHVYLHETSELKEGTLCYAKLNHDQSDVEALFPVMISRTLYSVSPWDLLHESLRPASSLAELSPADRVFGWVHADAEKTLVRNQAVAARGLLRLGPITCISKAEECVETFGEQGFPLAVLSTPKPQQGRFYAAQTLQGEAQNDDLTKKDAGYTKGKGLRGRKVYPHHKSLPKGYWDDPTEDRTQQETRDPKRYQEYRRPQKNGKEQRDDQNRSVLGWVKPETTFSFDLHIHNLSKVELGALLWLLTLPQDRFFRLGGGKPLGFGSVRLELDKAATDLRTGNELLERYKSWQDAAPNEDTTQHLIQETTQAYQKALSEAYGPEPDVPPPFITAFRKACTGHDDDLPTHYPRTTHAPNPDGESFEWFTENEKTNRRYALQDLANDTGLPVLKSQKTQK